MAWCDSPYRDRELTAEQKDMCYRCADCEVEMLDTDKYVTDDNGTVFCCDACREAAVTAFERR